MSNSQIGHVKIGHQVQLSFFKYNKINNLLNTKGAQDDRNPFVVEFVLFIANPLWREWKPLIIL